jgi:hypothetical protein
VPELLDQPVARHYAARLEQEQRQQGSLLAGPQVKRASVLDDLKRAKYAELHAPIEQAYNKVATRQRHPLAVIDERSSG